MDKPLHIEGSCHCGRVKYSAGWRRFFSKICLQNFVIPSVLNVAHRQLHVLSIHGLPLYYRSQNVWVLQCKHISWGKNFQGGRNGTCQNLQSKGIANRIQECSHNRWLEFSQTSFLRRMWFSFVGFWWEVSDEKLVSRLFEFWKMTNSPKSLKNFFLDGHNGFIRSQVQWTRHCLLFLKTNSITFSLISRLLTFKCLPTQSISTVIQTFH